MRKLKKILIATNTQKVLDFFLDHLGKELTEKEIQAFVKISKSGVNYALKDLVSSGALYRIKKGRMSFYSLDYKIPSIKQLKILKVIICLEPIIKRLEKLSSQIILFGSSAHGEDISDSDIDLFIISNFQRDDLEKEIKKVKLKRKIQLIVKTELGHTELKTKDPDFYEQIQRGIVLWKKKQ